jgi:hypothetical protein
VPRSSVYAGTLASGILQSMSCPSCTEGLNRLEMAPGYFSCRGTRRWTTVQMLPAATIQPPWIPRQMVPVTQHHEAPCRISYQEETELSHLLPLCECSTWSVGVCAECDVPVCGKHSSMVDAKRHCEVCSLRKQTRRKAAAEEASGQAREQARRKAAAAEDERQARNRAAAERGEELEPGPDTRTVEEKVVDTYWELQSAGNGDMGEVAHQLGMTLSEATQHINAAGRSGVFEQRR